VTSVPPSSVATSDALWLLDTDVVSELRKVPLGRCDPRVRDWAAGTRSSQTFLSAITIEELTRGVLHKERQDQAQGAALRRWLDEVVLPAYEGRILAVDTEVARTAAGLHVPDPAPAQDAFIAATALVNGLIVVTGNVRDFARFEGLAVHDPWEGRAS
jgi:predicted nucleic acid-binding protein